MKIQRHLSPTAAPLSPMDVLIGMTGLVRSKRLLKKIELEIKDHFGVKHVFLLTSGTAALTTILKGLRESSQRRKVVIPAYTCFTIPSAVINAGLQVVLCDVDPQTLDFDLSELSRLVDQEILAIVAPHLLGRPANIDNITVIGRSAGAYIIEDAAQAMGGKHRGRWLGTQGDVGFFSLGRGKNVSAGSGGVIITNSDRMAEYLSKVYGDLPVDPLLSSLKNLCIVAGTMVFLSPNRYWLPAGLHFLGLGRTRFYEEFPVCRMDGGRAGLLWSWCRRLDESNRYRDQITSEILERLSILGIEEPQPLPKGSTYLRFPLMTLNGDRKRALCAFAEENGLGVSFLYPCPINEIPQLKGTFGKEEYPGAKRLAERLITLPVHQLVVPPDLDRIAEALQGQQDLRMSLALLRREPHSPK